MNAVLLYASLSLQGGNRLVCLSLTNATPTRRERPGKRSRVTIGQPK
jgi:hypothetical protein